MPVVGLDLQATQEREVRREKLALQGSLCQVPQGVQGVLDPRVKLDPLDLQAIPLEDKTASMESLGVPACKETEVTQEKRARKVRKVTPV